MEKQNDQKNNNNKISKVKGNVISIDIEKIPKEYIIDGLRNI